MAQSKWGAAGTGRQKRLSLSSEGGAMKQNTAPRALGVMTGLCSLQLATFVQCKQIHILTEYLHHCISFPGIADNKIECLIVSHAFFE